MANTTQLNNDILKTLSPEERELALSILGDLSTGNSQSYEDLKYAEYKEIPVDFLTFIDDDRYLGKAWKDANGKSKMYPYWRKKLCELFPDNVTTAVNNAIFSGARGIGKSENAIAAALYLMHRVMCLKDPLAHYHLKTTDTVVFAFMNITQKLSEEIGITKLQNTVKLSPWFMERGSIVGRTNPLWEPPEPIRVVVGSQAKDVIGQAVIFGFFDEISFIRNQDLDKQKAIAKDMINTCIGGMKTRYIYNGENSSLLILASSKRSDKSFLEEHMRKKLEDEQEEALIVDEPVWRVKPPETYSGKRFKVALGNKFLTSQVVQDGADIDELREKGYKIIDVPVELKSEFIMDIDRALCDFAGISSSEISKYISGEAWRKCIDESYVNPFSKEILEIGLNDDIQYKDFFDLAKIKSEYKNFPLFIHMDMSLAGDKTGIAGTWITRKRVASSETSGSSDLYLRVAFAVDIKAPRGTQISLEKNRRFIYWLKEVGFNIKGITTDTFQSADTGQTLLQRNYPYKVLSVDRVDTDHICRPYQYFRNCIYEQRVTCFYCEKLSDEVTDLERNINTGKVDHPDGHCFTGDTKVSLVDGRELTFVELVEECKQGKSNYVYSFNHNTKCIEPRPIKKAWMTIKDANLVEVRLDNNEVIRCTPSHRFMLRDGSYEEAQYLKPGQPLMPLYRKISGKGLQGYRLYYEPLEEGWHYEHRRFVVKNGVGIKKDEVVHHINFVKSDNTPTNLKIMSRSAHRALHNRKQSDEERSKRSLSIKKWHEEHRNTEEYARRAEKTRQSTYAHLGEEAARKREAKQTRILEMERMFGVDWGKLTLSEKCKLSNEYTRLLDPTVLQRISNTLSKRHKEGLFDNAVAALRKYDESIKGKPRSEEDKEKMRAAHRRIKEYKNHKVVSVTYLDYTADVYDIEVEGNHNFALSSGVFVHNSKDLCDAVCGSLYNASTYADQFAYDYGEVIDTIKETNMDMDKMQRQQLTVDLEDELKSILQPASIKQQIQEEKKDSQSNDLFYLNQGIFII